MSSISATGLRTDPPIKPVAGNLPDLGRRQPGRVGDGYLIVAQPDGMVVFCQNSRLIRRYIEEIAREPEKASGHYKLARAAEVTGDDALALESYTKALAVARPSEQVEGGFLIDAARDQRHGVLMRLGRKAREARDWADAAARFESAARSARLPRAALAARLELAEVQAGRGDPAAGVATLQAALADEALRAVSVATPDGQRSVRPTF